MAFQALIPAGMWLYRIGTALYKTRQAAVAARLVQNGGKLVTKLKPKGRPGDSAKDITPKEVNSVKQVDKIVGIKPGQGPAVKTQILGDAKEQVEKDRKRLDDLREKSEVGTNKSGPTASSRAIAGRKSKQRAIVKRDNATAAAAKNERSGRIGAAENREKSLAQPSGTRRKAAPPATNAPPATSPQPPAVKPKADKTAAPGTSAPSPKKVRPKLRPDANKKYNTVGEAQNAGQLYFYDRKSGLPKVAVTKEQLKKSGKTLTEWTNDEIKKRKTKLNKGGMMPKKKGASMYNKGGAAKKR
jgi:hypothetical protein|tara:strand:- start:220 stop:1119 length:900 start_codon:yes stop_codon:yes gene_type:complete